MRYTPLSKDTYKEHRRRFAESLQPGSLAVFYSNDIMPTSGDGTMPFKQSADIFYLTGADQEETILVVFPDAFNKAHREILFLRETNEKIAIWEGDKLTKEQASKLTGIETVMWLKEFPTVMKVLMSQAEHVYLNSNEHTRSSNEVETREERLGKALREEYPLHEYERAAPIMHRLRSVKTAEEVLQIQKACKITEAAFRRVLEFVKPGVLEYEIEAEYCSEFLRRGSRGFAYTPIIASGFNSCVLHYIANDQQCKDGDMLLLDVAAEYGNYASDLTRTIPVNGRYTKRQKDVYNAVLRVHREAIKILRPGVFVHEYQEKVGLMIEKELVDLGLLTMDDIKNQDPAWPAYKKYFMHGTSHFMGLDVHDVGLWTEPVKAGNVFTVEPGIYIREEGFGVRIENNFLIEENGFVDLMKDIPIEAEEIEELMNS